MANVIKEVLDEAWSEIGGLDGAVEVLKQVAKERGVAVNSDIEPFGAPEVLGDEIPTRNFVTTKWPVNRTRTVLRKDGDECLN